jgi:hypothetical protein
MSCPKLKSQANPELLKKNLLENRICQSLDIQKNSFIVDSSCEYCHFYNINCMMDNKNQKCCVCIRRDRTCECCFYSEYEWQYLKNAKKKISLDIEKNENKIK